MNPSIVDTVLFNTFGFVAFAGIVWCFFDSVKKNRSVES